VHHPPERFLGLAAAETADGEAGNLPRGQFGGAQSTFGFVEAALDNREQVLAVGTEKERKFSLLVAEQKPKPHFLVPIDFVCLLLF
jgi:hypothetical protein